MVLAGNVERINGVTINSGGVWIGIAATLIVTTGIAVDVRDLTNVSITPKDIANVYHSVSILRLITCRFDIVWNIR